MPRHYSSEDDSSESEIEFEDMEDVLKSLKLRKKYWKIFKKAKIVEFEDCESLTDSKLKKLGIASSSHRKKILKTLEEIESDSESEYDYDSEYDSDLSVSSDEEVEFDDIKAKLKKNGLANVVKLLRKNKLDSYDKLLLINSRKLKKIGVDSSKTRDKVLKILSSFDKQRTRSLSSTSTASLSGNVSEKDIILKILRDNGFGSLECQFIEHGVTNFDAAENLGSNKLLLKELGLYRHNIMVRLNHMFNSDNLTKYKNKAKSKGKETEDKDHPMLKALKRVKMEKHFQLLLDNNINSVREAQDLTDSKLIGIGIKNEGQRALIIECMAEADWKCSNCNAWNENRKTCLVCQRTHRILNINSNENNFEIGDLIKYIGKNRPQTKTNYGAKGEIHRVLDDGKFYMVRFLKNDGKMVKIRLAKAELKKRRK